MKERVSSMDERLYKALEDDYAAVKARAERAESRVKELEKTLKRRNEQIAWYVDRMIRPTHPAKERMLADTKPALRGEEK